MSTAEGVNLINRRATRSNDVTNATLSLLQTEGQNVGRMADGQQEFSAISQLSGTSTKAAQKSEQFAQQNLFS